MKIRRARESDALALSKIVGMNYSKKYGKRAKLEIEAMFKNYVYKPEYFVAEHNGKIMGFAGCIQSWMDYSIYQIFWVNVLREYQGKGTGTLLVERALRVIKKKREAKFVLLTTKKPSFYRKFGFRILIKIGKNEYLMSLNLKK